MGTGDNTVISQENMIKQLEAEVVLLHQRLSEANGKLDKANKRVVEQAGTIVDYKFEIAGLEAGKVVLNKRVEEYREYHKDCWHHPACEWMNEAGAECTCGYDKALRSLGGEE